MRAAAVGVVLVASLTVAPAPARGSAPRPAPLPASSPATLLAAMSLRQEVGQLLMLGTPSTTVPPSTTDLIRRYGVGGVVLLETSQAGISGVAGVTRRLQAAAGVPLLVAADQEGGQVQRLQGPGFTRMPSALAMGRWSPDRVRAEARVTAEQLRRAGVDLDLAPVLDTVPRANRLTNQPIGRYDREFGFTPKRVTSRGVAFAQGLAAGGVASAVKHFPGLGRVLGNTDVVGGVTDTVTTSHDRYLRPFRRAVRGGVPFVLVSSAIYTRIDPHRPAVLSRAVITDLLRRRLGFDGVVVSDSLSAAQLAHTSVARRVVRFVRAGGDLALTTAPSQVPAMSAALRAEARRSPAFHRLLDAAALRVLRAKSARGLL